ncbi:MAG: UvrD-helicase domain-containing protein [Candidatus Pacebacteria bacterium]|nr:ATP-dependent DNA helicase PcrA [bacterium]MDP6527499.1 UvrD-helicase domain-containing protein [Candidatus Paceibacterota bacterium]MDP6659861.1 UvrD-helicase domain-containing protein [Candidatus Paceibacterota bacterium]
MNTLDSLNKMQREAALHKDGPLLILAGAGAGKTKTITERIVNLIQNGISPEKILAVTFTNKAAGEMKDRVRDAIHKNRDLNTPITALATGSKLPFVSTFHSLGVHILRENARLLGMNRNFTIFDRNDSIRAIKEASKRVDIDTKRFEARKLLSSISKQKGNGINSETYSLDANDYYKNIIASVWSAYEEILRSENAFDFDDLLLKTALLLQKNENVRKHYQNVWEYIHIDEYQDTNDIQYELTRLLAGDKQNICVVGDIDQTIYSWRGANIDNLLLFEETFPNTKVVILEENYRSTKTILGAANEIIEKNVNRKEKKLFTKKEGGEKILLYGAYNEENEANFITEKISYLLESGVSLNEIAVLYRANFQSRELEEAFLYKGIPYQVLGTKFFERKEVKDTLSFLRLSLNKDSHSDLKRIINVPPRGIGKVTMLKMIEDKTDTLTPAMKKRVDDFYLLMSKIKESAEKNKVSETIKLILSGSGIEHHLKKGDDEDLERLENIKELVTLAIKYDSLKPEEGVEKLLEDAALATEQDSLESTKDAVKLMTVHASKGLEFDYVFITGLEDGLFPHEGMEEDRDEEEERRLFYVALTRARKQAILSFASTRMIYGSREVNVPSEFITDISEEHMNSVEDGDEMLTIE